MSTDVHGPAADEVPLGDGSSPATEPTPVAVEHEALDDEDWLAPDRTRRVRLAVPTAVLSVLVVAAAAFWGGAALEKHHGSGTTLAVGRGGATGFAGRAGGAGSATGGAEAGGATAGGAGTAGAAAGGFSGGGGFAGRAGGRTPTATGTVASVTGDTLVVHETGGRSVTVTLSSTTTVTRIQDGPAAPIAVGDTVRVFGTASGSTVKATSVTDTAAGVSATAGFGGGAGGFGGGGAFGGGGGGGSGGGAGAGAAG